MRIISLAAIAILGALAAQGQPPVGDPSEDYRQKVQANPRSSLAHFRLGQALRQKSSFQAAAAEFNLALEGDHEPAWTVVWSYINLGKIFQVTEPARARQQFALAVQTGDTTAGALKEAANRLQWLRAPTFSATPSFGTEGTVDELPLPPGAYRVKDGVVGPIAVSKTPPAYSPQALVAGLEGTAVVTGIVDENGAPRDMRVTRSLGLGLDEKAVEAISAWRFKPGTFAERPIPVFVSFAIDFRLPAKQSRWHLTQATFDLPEGSSTPIFETVPYPGGDGISADAIEEGQLVGATGRTAAVTVQFEIDERGVPVSFRVLNSSADVWGNEAIRVARAWRFKPGLKDGRAVAVPSIFTFSWGQRSLPASEQSEMPYLGDPLASRQDFHPPIVLQMAPIYPLDAQLARIQGTVTISLIVNEKGEPRDLRVIEPVGHGLDEAALAVVSSWRFRPIVVNGRAEPVPSTVRVEFRLPSPARKK